MAVTTYDYPLTDFPNDRVNVVTLRQQIEAPGSGVLIQLNSTPTVTTVSGVANCRVVFKAALPAPEKAALDGVVAAHQGAPSSETDRTYIINDESEIVNWPMTSGKTPIYNPNILPPGYMLYVTGAFDNLETGKLGEGAQIQVTQFNQGLAYIEGQFLTHVYMLGGDFGMNGGVIGDWTSMMAWAPASSPSSTPGVGNANKMAVGPGMNIILPAPGGDGDWTVDGSTLQVGEINAGLTPVPNKTDAGFWHWDPDEDPSIYPVSNPLIPDGQFDLYDFPLPLVRQANRVSLLLYAKECCPPTIKGKKVLPHWKLRFYLNRESAGAAEVAFELKVARHGTVNSDDLL